MLIEYNKKMKAPLKWSRLYKTKSDAPDDDYDVEYEENDSDYKE